VDQNVRMPSQFFDMKYQIFLMKLFYECTISTGFISHTITGDALVYYSHDYW